MLSPLDHPSDGAGLRYVYPVVSRRSGGLSVGINLNTNQACNWRCIYCQVPGLVRGSAPPVDLALLERELHDFLRDVLQGDFMQRRVPADMRTLRDIAIAGDGEPTSATLFPEVIDCIARVRATMGVSREVDTVLITNGSGMGRARVIEGVRRLGAIGGQVWFKLDRATRAGIAEVNSVDTSPALVETWLAHCARTCPTWVQTCLFTLDNEPPGEAEEAAYLALIARLVGQAVPLRGVMLYGPARRSFQPEAPRIGPLPMASMKQFAARIAAMGLEVRSTA